MILIEILVPILGLILVLNSIFHSSTKTKNERRIEFSIGLVIMGISIAVIVDNFYEKKELTAANEKLQNTVNELKDGRKSDSIINQAFRDYVRDTIGVDIKNGKPTVINNTVFNRFITSKEDSTPVKIPVSDNLTLENNNYIISTTPDGRTSFYPKTGYWSSPIFGAEESKHTRDDASENGTQLMYTYPVVYTINKKKYEMIIWKVLTPPIKSNPFLLNYKKFKGEYIIFGDFANPANQFAFKDGRVFEIKL